MNGQIHTCPRCSSTGNVIKHIKIAVKIKCPECEKQWYADSKICPKCGKPNGFAVDGVCSTCYSINHRDEPKDCIRKGGKIGSVQA